MVPDDRAWKLVSMMASVEQPEKEPEVEGGKLWVETPEALAAISKTIVDLREEMRSHDFRRINGWDPDA